MPISALQSLLIPALIGLLSAAFALPLAWWLARSGNYRFERLFAPVSVAMMMPPYLAFAGWSLLRAPGTFLGDRLAAAPAWVNLGSSQALAVFGLALWSVPLATLILVPACRGIDSERLESLRLDGAGVVRTVWLVLWWLRGGLTLAAGAVALLMVGSAVPLHLAQFRTVSVELWSSLMLRPELGTILEAWPVVVVAVCAGVAAAFGAARAAPDEVATRTRQGGRATAGTRVCGALGLGIWLAGTVAPLLLFTHIAPAWPLVAATVNRTMPAFVNSLVTALAVMGTVFVLGCVLCAAAHAGGLQRKLAAVCLGALMATGVLPGVMVGMVLRLAGNQLGRLFGVQPADEAFMVAAHCLRFGVVVAVAAWWLWAGQPRDLKDAYALDAMGEPSAERARGQAGGGWAPWAFVRTWMITHARTDWPVLAFAALACGVLSLHEIEAAVMLQAPGAGTLSQRVLDLLHYNRDTDLASIAAVLIGSCLIVSMVAAVCVGRVVSREARPGR